MGFLDLAVGEPFDCIDLAHKSISEFVNGDLTQFHLIG